MKKQIICIVVLLLVFATACSNNRGVSGDTVSQSTENSVGADDNSMSGNDSSASPIRVDAVPEMTAEQQELCDQYLTPLLYSNFFVGNYYSKTLDADWGIGGIITIYQDLVGEDVWTGLVNEQYQIAASDVEGALMRYFPFDEQTIRVMADTFYIADENVYIMAERGGGIRSIVVTGSTQIDDTILEISYELYGPSIEFDAANEAMSKDADGWVQVELLEDGRFQYINNEMDFS